MKTKTLSTLAAAWFAALASLGGCRGEHAPTGPAPEHRGEDDQESGIVKLSAEAIRSHGVEVAEAAGGRLQRTITVPAEVTANADRLAHIVPRVPGVVREVRKSLGDHVEPHEILAVLDSRELAEAKAACRAGVAREELARTTLARATSLSEEKIIPEKELLKARNELAETQIEHRMAEAKLYALGLTEDQAAALHTNAEKDIDYPRYEIKAPFEGTVIEKHITLGEVVGTEDSMFVIADLSSVWVDITLYTNDLPQVRLGMEVTLAADGFDQPTHATVVYISPTVSEATRSGFARAVVPNPERTWRPGLFCSASIVVSETSVDVLVPNSALQAIENQTVVFIEDEGGFKKRAVTVGRTNGAHSEILNGLLPGDRYVAKGTFILKAELGKATAKDED